MLKNIKSSYFSIIILSFLDEKVKLQLIKYNKSLQKKLDIKIINYQFFSGKYIIYESKIRGKEYYGYFDKLIYDGEYLKGKRYRKGTEYDLNGTVIFEGEYLNGLKQGQGKEYNHFGELMFEGEYSKDKTWKGKVFNGNGIIIYQLDNTGKNIIKLYKKGRLIFEGEYLNGKGKEYDDYGKLM